MNYYPHKEINNLILQPIILSVKGTASKECGSNKSFHASLWHLALSGSLVLQIKWSVLR
jgi:hypothetical protein